MIFIHPNVLHMSTKTIVGVFDRWSDAEDTVHQLISQGVRQDEISYAQVDKYAGAKAGSGAAVGATTGAVVGAIAGLVVANGILPGLGTLFVAGPLATALGLSGAVATTAAGAMTGVAAGGVIGALNGYGIGLEEAQDYEDRLREGAILMTVHSDVPVVAQTLRDHQATEVREYADDKQLA